jgi:hypothetical protein
MAAQFRSRPDGSKYPIGGRRKSKGTGIVVVTAAAAVLAGGGAVSLGGAGSGAAGNNIAGNLAGDVVDSLPGRKPSIRKEEGRKSAQRGRSNEAWSRLKFKELKRKTKTRLNCVASSTGRVREFLMKTPCTSLDGMLLLVGDGHGNAAVVSVVRIGFRTAAQASAFQKVEDVGGSGDVRPLDISAELNLVNVKMTGFHYYPRRDKTARIIGEADTAAGHIDKETLKALAYVGSYLPIA